jgi:MFS family permease
MSWLSTGISVGVACGATAAGFILDAFGARWGYAFAAASGGLAVLTYLGGLRWVGAPRGAGQDQMIESKGL